MLPLSPAARAFDTVAERFDERFGQWESVAAQRRAVRAELARVFPRGARVLEIGGGTGEDACWLAERGREVTVTDASPSMVRIANAKLRSYDAPQAQVIAAEQLASAGLLELEGLPFDGAFSNFAALNCVADLALVGRGLAGLIRPGGTVMMVLFGVCSPGEWLVELSRGKPRAAFRRFTRGEVPARLGGCDFVVRYHRRADVVRAMAPWFRLRSRRGVGVFVPPSGAEPGISRHPRLLKALEGLDKMTSRPLAMLGDHVIYELERTTEPAPARGPGSLRRFRTEYGAHRAAEGRALERPALLTLPYLTSGRFARQWSVRARTFDTFVTRVLRPMAADRQRPLRIVDLGAGNGWLSWRAALAGHEAVAVDLRDDDVDGLRAALPYREEVPGGLALVAGSFDAIPVADASADLVVFNASLHYAVDPRAVLAEARRIVRSDGRIVVLDSPFYRRAADGDAMVAEKRRTAARQFGDRADALLSMNFIEYLTRESLSAASAACGIVWRRHRVTYPLWYEMRPLIAAIRRKRAPSRFDLWEGTLT